MGKVHRNGTAYAVSTLKARHKRLCASAPNAPANVTVTFNKRETKERHEWAARVKWDAVTTDVAARPLSVEQYAVQFRATDASGVPVEVDGVDNDFWRQQVPADEDRRAVFHPLPKPRTYYFQARVRVLNRIHGGKCWSAWSGWTAATQPVTGALPGPPAVTGLSLSFDSTEARKGSKYDAVVAWNETPQWTPADGDVLDGSDKYITQLQVSADGVTPLRTRRRTVAAHDEDADTTRDVTFGGIRKARYYRARVRPVDIYGRRGAWSSWTSWTRPSQAVGNPQNVATTKPVPRVLVTKWDEPADPTDVDQYRVEVYQGLTLKETVYTRGRHHRYNVPEADKGLAHRVKVTALDEDGNVSGTADPGADTTEGGTLDGSIIAAGTLDVTPFASSIRPVQLVSSNPALPNASYPNGSVIYNTSTQRLYQNNGGAWVDMVSAGNMSGQISASQIVADSITAGQIAAGAIAASEIAAGAVTADKVSVTSLSAISATLGTVDSGTLKSGSVFAAYFSTDTYTGRGGSHIVIDGSTAGGADQIQFTSSGTTAVISATGGGIKIVGASSGQLGFWGATPIARPADITGSRGTNTANVLKQLLDNLQAMGLITHSTTA